MAFTEENRESLRTMLDEMQDFRQKRRAAINREKGRRYGKKMDQIEICYKQYSPPQSIS